MNLNFGPEASANAARLEIANNEEENEYQLMIGITSIKLFDESIRKVQIILLCGELMAKFDMCRNGRVNNEEDAKQEGSSDDDDHNFGATEQKTFTIHSTPTNLAKKLAELSIIFSIVDENQAALGDPMMIELQEYFWNAVKCQKFAKESLTKSFYIVYDEHVVGEISIVIIVKKEFANSNRFRSFYTQSTAAEMQNILE